MRRVKKMVDGIEEGLPVARGACTEVGAIGTAQADFNLICVSTKAILSRCLAGVVAGARQ